MPFDSLVREVRRQQTAVYVDSRQVTPGSVFVAVPGAQEDGNHFIPQAILAGARTLVCQQPPDHVDEDLRIVVHPDPRAAVWHLAQALYGTDSLTMQVVGITGTNGKTTTAYVLEHVFSALGRKVGVLGTVNYRWPGFVQAAPLTTPDTLTLHRMLAQMQAAGVDIAFLEMSSHALDQQRAGGIVFDGAIFSNLTQDHLDFHADMEHYFHAKAKLFTELPRQNKSAVINADDAFGRRLLSMCPGALGFGLGAEGVDGHRHLHGRVLASSTAGVHLHMRLGAQEWELRSPLVGAFNASNLLAVQGLCLELGLNPQDLQSLEDFHGVSGRLERVPNPRGLDVFVDYAHSPDALVNVLQALRGAGFERIITLFGCGGNRDRTKRPRMGEAVALWSDVAVLTSDNPRFEKPEDIIADVLPGLERAKEVVVEADRRTATQVALNMLRPGDALLVAGKGHEEYQLIEGVKHSYSDQQTIRELLKCV
ncbi:MAG: UDP-N-acetylmuramoyl-L-alanyl-D-glutamate--2,6-diaminopimelate ligase [Desulfovibrionaceae bacterium]